MKKIFKDIFSTLYDDLDFKCLSLPRVLVAVGFMVVMVAWIMEQFYGRSCPHFPELCGFFGGGSLANFMWSKYTDLKDPLIKKLNEGITSDNATTTNNNEIEQLENLD